MSWLLDVEVVGRVRGGLGGGLRSMNVERCGSGGVALAKVRKLFHFGAGTDRCSSGSG